MRRLKTIPSRLTVPKTRDAVAHDFNVANHKGRITVGLFEDGTPCELFIFMDKEGPTINGLLNAIARLTSFSLQHGGSITGLVNKMVGQRFEPSGFTDNPDIRFAHSIVDYVFQWLGQRFMPDFAEKTIPPSDVVHNPVELSG